jgi:SagB-type dehydrogenase family enzyme
MDNLTISHAPDPEHLVKQVLAYHRLSKHNVQRYAPGPAHLDWANQPDPLRTFAGASVVQLPLLADALRTSYANLYVPRATSPRRVDINSVAILLELSLGLSAWKEYHGSRWALRCNPSSGNLHPTEGYALLPALPGLDAGLYHYVSRDHILEGRTGYSAQEAAQVADGLPAGSFLIGLSSIHWREAWKYGVRGFRYCQHDVGHALAAIRYAAASLGWSAWLLGELGDDTVSAWLGLRGDQGGWTGVDPLDREHADAMILIGPPPLGTGGSRRRLRASCAGTRAGPVSP